MAENHFRWKWTGCALIDLSSTKKWRKKKKYFSFMTNSPGVKIILWMATWWRYWKKNLHRKKKWCVPRPMTWLARFMHRFRFLWFIYYLYSIGFLWSPGVAIDRKNKYFQATFYYPERSKCFYVCLKCFYVRSEWSYMCMRYNSLLRFWVIRSHKIRVCTESQHNSLSPQSMECSQYPR